MNMKTITGKSVNSQMVHNYFSSLVDCFFKILPMKEEGESTLATYMRSLQIELIGCQALISSINNDSSYLTLLSILQFLIDTPECEVYEVRREIFRAISICNKLKARYAEEVLK